MTDQIASLRLRGGTRRVVVTGIGLVSAIGCDLAAFCESLFAGRSGVAPLPDPAAAGAWAAARVAGFQPLPGLEHADRSIQFAVAAARAAAADAGLSREALDGAQTGVSIASSKGGVLSFCNRASDAWLWNYLPASPAGAVAREFGCTGPTSVPAAACAAGSHAVIAAARMIADGEAEIVLAGATEASITPLISVGFGKLGVLAKDGICRPFDARRSGFVIGEGAAVMVLESAGSAAARGAAAYAEVAGYARAADAHGIVAFDESGAGVGRAIRAALDDAAVPPDGVDYINAHATGTVHNDIVETKAIKLALGPHAAGVPVSGTKPITGHLLGAAGAIETAICLLAMRHGLIPPTINYAAPDPRCDLDCVPCTGRKADVRVALNLSFGFGGQIGVIVLRR